MTEKARRGNKMIAQQEKRDGGVPACLSARARSWKFSVSPSGSSAADTLSAILAQVVFV